MADIMDAQALMVAVSLVIYLNLFPNFKFGSQGFSKA